MIQMNLDEYRKQIDEIDKALVKLFAERMHVAENIANYKREKGLPVLDSTREKAKILEVREMVPDELKDYISTLYISLFEVSRSYQTGLMAKQNTPPDEN